MRQVHQLTLHVLTGRDTIDVQAEFWHPSRLNETSGWMSLALVPGFVEAFVKGDLRGSFGIGHCLAENAQIEVRRVKRAPSQFNYLVTRVSVQSLLKSNFDLLNSVIEEIANA